jgi:hypothetical protein
MCNACGFLCCGSDQFEGCGCDGCECPDCWTADCEGCQQPIEMCGCVDDDFGGAWEE